MKSADIRRLPRFYFSLRSPYSWLAHWDLTTRYADVAERLHWIPFWEPDGTSERMLADAGARFHYTPMSRAKHLYILQDVRRLAADRGLAVKWPVDREPWWEVPHLAYLAADRRGCGRRFVEVVYRVRWLEGRDICDRTTMAEVGRELGLDPDELSTAVDDPELRAQSLEALLATHADGVFGVPFFVSGFEKFWGVDRLETFLAALRRQESRPPLVGALADASGPTSDGGHAGGCG